MAPQYPVPTLQLGGYHWAHAIIDNVKNIWSAVWLDISLKQSVY